MDKIFFNQWRKYLLKKGSVLCCVFLFFNGNLFSQEDASGLDIGGANIKLQYEKIAEGTIRRIWEESVDASLKFPIEVGSTKFNVILGGAVVSYDSMIKIPEMKALAEIGRFPKDRVFIRHVCEINFEYGTDIIDSIDWGIRLPYRMVYIQSIPFKEAMNHELITKKVYAYFSDAIHMNYSRIKNGIVSLGRSTFIQKIPLDTGEQFSLERFGLLNLGLGLHSNKWLKELPVLDLNNFFNFKALGITKNFAYVKSTVQNMNKGRIYRVTVSKKKITSYEFLSTRLGIQLKAAKKLLGLISIKLSFNLFEFKPVRDFYDTYHYQYVADFSKKSVIKDFKKSFFLGSAWFMKKKRPEFEFQKTVRIKGIDSSTKLNLFHVFRSENLQRVESRLVQYADGTEKCIGVGGFYRSKHFLLDRNYMNCEIVRDFSFLKGRANEGDFSGLKFKNIGIDKNGLNYKERWHLKALLPLLNKYIPKAKEPVEDMISLKNKNSKYRRELTIQLDAYALNELLNNADEIKRKTLKLYEKIYAPMAKKLKRDLNRRRYPDRYPSSKYILKKIQNRIHQMNEYLLVKNSNKKSIKKLSTPGLFPLNQTLMFLIASCLDEEHICLDYKISKIELEERLFEKNTKPKIRKFQYHGSKFHDDFNKLKFHY